MSDLKQTRKYKFSEKDGYSNKILVIVIFTVLIFSLKKAFSTDDITKAGPIDPKKALSKDEYSLYKATYMGRSAKVKRLAESGVNVNVKSPNSKRTPLHIAASKGRTQIIKTLVSCGADVQITDESGKTPLQFAVEAKQEEAIRFLLSSGAKVTPEIIAIASDKIKLVLNQK